MYWCDRFGGMVERCAFVVRWYEIRVGRMKSTPDKLLIDRQWFHSIGRDKDLNRQVDGPGISNDSKNRLMANKLPAGFPPKRGGR